MNKNTEERLFKEFLDTKKIKPNKKHEKELFKYWLEEKKEMLMFYEGFLETIDFIPSRGVVEIGKSEYDSILPYTPIDTLGIALSDDFSLYEKENRKIAGVKGNIEIVNNKVILKYDSKEKELDFINTYITQCPSDVEIKDLLVKLICLNKNVFIGTYGRLDDANMEGKLIRLQHLQNQIEKYTNKDMYGELAKTSNYYFAAITPKMKYKTKK